MSDKFVEEPTKKTYTTLPQLATQADIPLSWLYERSRRDALPGLRRIGKYVRIDAAEFFEAVEAGKLK